VNDYEDGRSTKIDVLEGQLQRNHHSLTLPNIPTRKMTLAELYQNCRNSVLVVGHLYNCSQCGRQHVAIGAGSVVTASGVIATSYHVVDRPDSLAMGAMTADGRVYAVKEVLAADSESDVALLQLDGSAFAPLALSPELSVGASVAMIGHPDRRFYTLTTGIVSHHFTVDQKGKEVPWITATNEIGPGSYGAPLLNESGAVVGIASRTQVLQAAQAETHQPAPQTKVSLFVPADAIMRLIRPPVAGPVPDPTQRAPVQQAPGVVNPSPGGSDPGDIRFVVGGDRVSSITSSGQVVPFPASYGTVRLHGDEIYVGTRNARYPAVTVCNRAGVQVRTIPIPAEVRYLISYVVLPDGGIAFLDNEKDAIYFVDQMGKYLRTVRMRETPDRRLQNCDGVVVGNKLIVSEDGDKHLLAVDLDTYEVTVFRDLSRLPGPWLGRITFAEGRFYICTPNQVFSFSPEDPAERHVTTLPQGISNITGIAYEAGRLFVVANHAGVLCEIDVASGATKTIVDGLKRPKDIVLLPKTIPGASQPAGSTVPAPAAKERLPDKPAAASTSPSAILSDDSEDEAINGDQGIAQFSKDLAIYLGCGAVNGPGTVVQVDRTGKVLGTIRLPGTPYGLAVSRDGLVAAVPGGRPAKVVRIDGQGKVETLLEDQQTIPNPIAIAADPSSGDVLIADNKTDVLLLLPSGQAKDARKVIQIKGHEKHLQNMSVAFAQDNYLLFGGSGPDGIYRFRAEKAADMGAFILRGDGTVAADPSSHRWAAALSGELRVFEDARELLTIPYPPGKGIRRGTVAFGPDGVLVIGLSGGQTVWDVFLVDQKAKTFNAMFSWNQSRVVSLAVGRKTALQRGQDTSAIFQTSKQESVSVATFLDRPSTRQPKFVIPPENLKIPEGLQACVENLRKIDAAVLKYRKDHGKPPGWLSDLVPDYLSQEDLFCPKDPAHTTLYAADPRLPCSYSWQLSSNPAPSSGGSPPPYRVWKDQQARSYGGVVPMVRCIHHGGDKILNLSIDGQIYWSQVAWESLFRSNPPSRVERSVPPVSNPSPESRRQPAAGSGEPRMPVRVALEYNTELSIGYYRPDVMQLSANEPPQNWLLPPIDSTTHRRFWAQKSFGRNTMMNILIHTPHAPESDPWDVFVTFDDELDFRSKQPVTVGARLDKEIEFNIAYGSAAKQPYAIRIHANAMNPGRYMLTYWRASIRTGTADVLGRKYGVVLSDDNADGLYSDLVDTMVLISHEMDGHRTYDNRVRADSPIRIGQSDYFTIEISDDGSSALLRPAAYGVLEGLVTQGPLNTAIPRARVKMTPYEFEALTDPNGRYEIRLPVGRYYEAQIAAQGYIPEHVRRVPLISHDARASLNIRLNLAQAPRSGEVTLYEGDSFHFLSGQRHKFTGGDFYFSCRAGEPKFCANNEHQGGLADLSQIQTPLDVVEPPIGRYSQFGVLAAVGHVYASPARQGEEGCYVIFRVTEIKPGESCTLSYYYRQGESIQ
jgi:S1-C subfamily serine protease